MSTSECIQDAIIDISTLRKDRFKDIVDSLVYLQEQCDKMSKTIADHASVINNHASVLREMVTTLNS